MVNSSNLRDTWSEQNNSGNRSQKIQFHSSLVDIFAITAKHSKQTLIRDGILHFNFLTFVYQNKK